MSKNVFISLTTFLDAVVSVAFVSAADVLESVLLEFAFLVLAVLFLAEDLLLPVLEEDLLPLPTVADLVEPPADFVLDGFAAPGVAVGFGVTRFTLEPGFPDGPDGFVVGVGSVAFFNCCSAFSAAVRTE